MIEFGLFPSFVTTRQISVWLRACHSRLIAPETSLALCIFAQPCGRPGCLAQILMNPNFRSNCGSFIILWRNDSRLVAMTWITVCISRLASAGNHSFCNPSLDSVCSRRSLGDAARGFETSLAALRTAKRLQQRTVHDVNIEISFFRMVKRAR